MTLQEFNDIAQAGAIGIIIILLGLIRIPKIEINLWSLLARGLGRALNGEVLEKVNQLTKDFEKHLQDEEDERVRQARQKIIRFNDEILCDRKHSKEHFDEILEVIDVYEHYCNTHPDYENNKAVMAIKTIKSVYKDCLKTHDFLVYSKKYEE